MIRVRLRIKVAGTTGTQAWDCLIHYGEASSGRFGPEEGMGRECAHPPDAPHGNGEWFGAVILVAEHITAEYAVAHYLEQPRVLDAYIDGREE